jgi:hypothetical protein
LLGARIGGGLDCSSGTFEESDDFALTCDSAKINGSVFLRDNFTAKGQVRFLVAEIGGDLDCSNGYFEQGKADGIALDCDGVKINGVVRLGDDFTAKGEVRIIGAKIVGDLYCEKCKFENANGDALLLSRTEVGGAFFLTPERLSGRIWLSNFHAMTLIDNLNCWPAAETMLDGFTYEHIRNTAPLTAKARIGWLGKQIPEHLGADFRTQPWDQLIRTLRAMGHFDEAREIAIEKQRRLRRSGKIPGLRGFVHDLFGQFVGYGYKPLRLAKIWAGVWLGCALIYYWAAGAGLMGPANPLVFDNPKYQHCRANWFLCEDTPGEYTSFNAFAYSLDLILPVVRLGQTHDWGPITPSAPQRSPHF